MNRDLQCVSQLTHPPVSNKALMAMFVITRHGARAPIDTWARSNETGIWNCLSNSSLAPKIEISGGNIGRRYLKKFEESKYLFKPSCLSGELLIDGMSQHKELGAFYRQYLVNEIGLLPEVFDQELIYVRSSHYERCIQSMMSFFDGFYPAIQPDETIKYVTGTKELEPLYPSSSYCKDIRIVYEKFLKSDEFQQRKAKSQQDLNPLFEYLELEKTEENWMWLGDWMYSYKCSNQNIPHVVTDQMFELAMNDTSYGSVGFYRMFPKENSGAIWRVILEQTAAILSGQSKAKFALLSGHDITIMALLASLDIVDLSSIPPYRSHLALELYNDPIPSIRFVMNGQVLKPLGEEYLPLSKLLNRVQDSIQVCLE